MGAAAFSAMFLTCITVLDSYARSLDRAWAAATGCVKVSQTSWGRGACGRRCAGHCPGLPRPIESPGRPGHHPVVPRGSVDCMVEPETRDVGPNACRGAALEVASGLGGRGWPSHAFGVVYVWSACFLEALHVLLHLAHEVEHLRSDLSKTRVVSEPPLDRSSLTLGSTYGTAKRASAP